MSMLTSSLVDVDSIAQALLKNNTFLMALSQNDVFVSGLSKNNKFVSAVSDNPVFIAKTRDLVNDELDSSFELRLIHASSEPLNRLVELETITGLTDFSEFYDDEEGIKQPRKPSIPERIKTLEDKIENMNVGASESPAIELKLKTKTGRRALYLIKKLKASGKDHLTHHQIKAALSDEELEDDRIDFNTQNPRKAIIDALKEAAKICSNVLTDKKKAGHKEYRLILNS